MKHFLAAVMVFVAGAVASNAFGGSYSHRTDRAPVPSLPALPWSGSRLRVMRSVYRPESRLTSSSRTTRPRRTARRYERSRVGVPKFRARPMRGLFCLDYDDPNVPQEVLVIEHVGV